MKRLQIAGLAMGIAELVPSALALGFSDLGYARWWNIAVMARRIAVVCVGSDHVWSEQKLNRIFHAAWFAAYEEDKLTIPSAKEGIQELPKL